MATNKEDLAFPTPTFQSQNGDIQWGAAGLSAQEYAAINLRVPASGTPWLDDMIRSHLRDEFAGKAMQAIESADVMDQFSYEQISDGAYRCADAMLLRRDGK